jgi:hypothetical protein
LSKKHLGIRMEPTLIYRLKRMARLVNAPIDDTISIALDALECKRKEMELVSSAEEDLVLTVGRRLKSMEENLLAMVELIETFDGKIDRNFSVERERLKALYLLIKANISDHDKAEKERFEKLVPRIF